LGVCDASEQQGRLAELLGSMARKLGAMHAIHSSGAGSPDGGILTAFPSSLMTALPSAGAGIRINDVELPTYTTEIAPSRSPAASCGKSASSTAREYPFHQFSLADTCLIG
jgi:hypothetical protein